MACRSEAFGHSTLMANSAIASTRFGFDWMWRAWRWCLLLIMNRPALDWFCRFANTIRRRREEAAMTGSFRHKYWRRLCWLRHYVNSIITLFNASHHTAPLAWLAFSTRCTSAIRRLDLLTLMPLRQYRTPWWPPASLEIERGGRGRFRNIILALWCGIEA